MIPRRDFFQFPCYFHPLVKIPQKFIVLELGDEGQKRKKREVLCNLVRGHNRYLVSAQQESAGGRDFLARASNLAEADIAK